MIYRIADNVLSPLGETTQENYQAVKAGRSALCRYDSYSGDPDDDFVASRFTDEQRQRLMLEGLTFFESLLCRSVTEALSQCDIPVGSPRTLLVVSTTKANVDHLASADYDSLQPAEAARRVARRLGITTQPVVVCNACISGVAAIITAQRLLAAGRYDTAIVTGCDVLSEFVVSGFQSLKAMSPEECRPFDIERIGLNLGEAAATLVLSSGSPSATQWAVVSGAVRNDAFHISSPSPKGEGCADAIRSVTAGVSGADIAALNVHGTATMYNDQMESKAIQAAELSDIPANTVKGYFGHTLGAAGILETVITMRSVAEGELLGTRGFSEIGVSGRMSISAETVPVGRQSFLKIISGFGGCNAAIYCRQTEVAGAASSAPSHDYTASHRIQVTPRGITVDGQPLAVTQTGAKMLTEVYKRYIGDYPKYYKMDALAQLGFVATELLLRQEGEHPERRTDRAIVLFNHSSSLCADRDYERSIADKANYFPSPSVFVYTLPNIVCGEMAIRHGYHAETSFYILNGKDEAMMHDILRSTFQDSSLRSILAGWIDRRSADDFEADLKIIQKTN